MGAECVFVLIMLYPQTNYGHDNYQGAPAQAANAAYKQSGLESTLNAYFDRQAERVPAEYKKLVMKIAPVAQMIIKQRIELQYDF